MPAAIVVMGVSGVGKSTIAADLAKMLGVQIADGDDFHAPQAVAAMASGTALTDADRAGWLERVGAWIAQQPDGCAVSCSALRRSYREQLAAAAGERLFFVHLSAPRASVAARIRSRTGHFMPESLLDSQYATLEPLAADEQGVTVDAEQPPAAILEAIIAALPA